jgi:hypothetical protein
MVFRPTLGGLHYVSPNMGLKEATTVELMACNAWMQHTRGKKPTRHPNPLLTPANAQPGKCLSKFAIPYILPWGGGGRIGYRSGCVNMIQA